MNLSIITINRKDVDLFVMLFMIKSQIFLVRIADFFCKNRRFFQ